MGKQQEAHGKNHRPIGKALAEATHSLGKK
jgi:hypothetical protein